MTVRVVTADVRTGRKQYAPQEKPMKRTLIAIALVLVAIPMAAQMTHPGRLPGLGMPS